MSENKMTAAPWRIDERGFVLGRGLNWAIIDPDDVSRADITAIVSAINNTYGASINPEAVPDMKKVLIELLAQFEKVVEPKYTLDFMLIKEAKAAIEKAKLPTP